MNNDLTRGERLQIMLTKDELEALDNWRFQKRMPSRAAAIRELLKRGLAAEGFNLVEGGSRSQDFGVTGDSTASGARRFGAGAAGDPAAALRSAAAPSAEDLHCRRRAGRPAGRDTAGAAGVRVPDADSAGAGVCRSRDQ